MASEKSPLGVDVETSGIGGERVGSGEGRGDDSSRGHVSMDGGKLDLMRFGEGRRGS